MFVRSALGAIIAGFLAAVGFYLFDRYARPHLGGAAARPGGAL